MDIETQNVTMKITLIIMDMDCKEFTEVLRERFRNEVIGINIIGDKLLLNFSAKFPP